MIDIHKLKPEYWRQLSLGIETDLSPDPSPKEGGEVITPQEANLRSEAARQALEVRKNERGHPEWVETYYQLRDLGWPWRVACYIAWAASPKSNRWPKTQDGLATEVLGLASDRVIGTWREKNPQINEMIALMQAAPLLEHRADILGALIQSASEPSYRNHMDRKLAIEMLGDYVPRSKVEVSKGEVEDLSQLSEAELQLLAGKLKTGDTDGTEGTDPATDRADLDLRDHNFEDPQENEGEGEQDD